MKLPKYVGEYSLRILSREWQKYVLPFFSLFLTALIVTVALSLTGSASTYLANESRALVGGDVTIQSSFPVDAEAVLVGIDEVTTGRSQTLSFNGTVHTEDNDAVVPVSLQVVDLSFPLYGSLQLEKTQYSQLGNDEILLDRAAAKKLDAQVGDTVLIGEVPYTVRDIITREPDVLFNTFKLLPKAIIAQEGFDRSEINPDLLRGEYSYAYRFDSLSETSKTQIRAVAKEKNLHLHLAGDTHSGFSRGFDVVTNFLIVAVLITALLAAVNVYASVTYLLNRLKRSLAVLRALGMSLSSVRLVVLLTFVYTVLAAGLLGIFGGYFVATYIRSLAQQFLEVTLPTVMLLPHIALVVLIVGATGIAALIPSLERLARSSPRALLMGDEDATQSRKSIGIFVLVTILAYTPLLFLASFLLKSITKGFVTIVSVIGAYVLIALLYRGGVELMYKARGKMLFGLRSIIAWKRYDGLFGIISFTSLYIALTALFVLGLTQTSLQTFLQRDIGATVPSMYVLDVQQAQAEQLTAQFPTLTLLPNIRGRILSIDGRDIQDALQNNASDVDGELRREFVFTYRTNLIEGEQIVAGQNEMGVPGTVSVDTEFASRAGIKLGSKIVVTIQGFPVTATVNNLRSVETTKGLPFFYFVFAPADVSQFPTSYFGYAYADETMQKSLLDFLARTMPNVSSIDTAEVGLLVQNTVSILLLIIFYIALPPFVLACALIVVLVILQYGTRRRDGARLLALGAQPRWVERQYLSETVSTTLLASVGAYVTAIAVTWYVTTYYLDLKMFTVYSTEIILGLLGIIGGMFAIGLLLWRTDKKSLQALLSYEDNH